MNEFQKYEQTGRDKFTKYAKEQFDIWNYEFSNEEYDSIDCVLTSGSSAYSPNVLVEIKDRKYKSTAPFIKKEGAMFELKKYNGMKQRQKDNNYSALFYVNFFADGKAYMFDIIELEKKGIFKWYKKDLPKHTAYNKGETELKDVCDLPLEYGIRIV